MTTMDYRIFPPEDLFEITIELPPSKSMAVRAIALAYLAGDMSAVAALADTCDDCRRLYSILSAGLPTDGSTIDCGDAGTAMRFVTALAASTPGCECVLTGNERMLCRPIGPLVDTLRSLGADIEYLGTERFPPLKVVGSKLRGGEAAIDATVSSQFVSALMMAAPAMTQPLTLHLEGNPQSLPYITMTAEMMSQAGIAAEVDRDTVTVATGAYKAHHFAIERDWSAAAFWYEIVAITAGWVTLPGLHDHSLQADRAIVPLFDCLGASTEFGDEGAELSANPDLNGRLEADMLDMPDAVLPLAVTAATIGVPFRLSGVGALHDKECDRLEALTTEMRKLGIVFEQDNYGTVIQWDGSRFPVNELPVFDCHGDHRLAMALAPIATFVPGIVITGAEAVSKSYPEFWTDFQRAGFTLLDPAIGAQQES